MSSKTSIHRTQASFDLLNSFVFLHLNYMELCIVLKLVKTQLYCYAIIEINLVIQTTYKYTIKNKSFNQTTMQKK